MNSRKKEVLIKILEEYNEEFNDCKKSFVESVYDRIVESELYTYDRYGGYSTELTELNLSDLIEELKCNPNIYALLSELYDGDYEYSWGGRDYKSMADSIIDTSDVSGQLGVDCLSIFIENNFAAEFNNAFKEDLELDDDYTDEDVDSCWYWDICEDYVYKYNELESYIDLVVNPEYIVEKWLEDEPINVSRIIEGRLKLVRVEDVKDELESIVCHSSTDYLKERLDSIIQQQYRSRIAKFIFDYVQNRVDSLTKYSYADLEKELVLYKESESIEDFLRIKSAYDNKKRIKEMFEDEIYTINPLQDKIVADIFDTLDEKTLRANYTKIKDMDLVKTLKQSLGVEYVDKLMSFTDEDIRRWINEYVEQCIDAHSVFVKQIHQEDFYDMYTYGAKIKNCAPLFKINKFACKNKSLIPKVAKMFKSISSLYRYDETYSKLSDEESVSVIKSVQLILAINLFDRPRRVYKYLEDNKHWIKDISLLSEEMLSIRENKELLDNLIDRLAEVQLYLLENANDIDVFSIDFEEIAGYKKCLTKYMESGFYKMLKKTYKTEHIKSKLKDVLSEDPKDEFPLARKIKRHFVINVGLTNTGKTYNSIERLKQCEKNGVYLAPLRLLALEIQEKLNNDGIVCSLSTGEEEDFLENATHESLTIEKADYEKEYGICVIDECQMISDDQRGYAWTNAILGICCKEIHLCTAPEGLNIILRLIESCGDTYEIIEHKRKTPLKMEDKQYCMPTSKKIGDVQEGDAFIVFSKKQALIVSAQLRNKGISTSIIYGALPYKSRKKQLEMFMNRENKVIVSTDAIGMGVNVPIKRIVFLESKKYDGKSFRKLRSSEVKQIAGRAGRFGMYDEGYVNALVDKKSIANLLISSTSDIQKANVMPPKTIIDIDDSLIQTIKAWTKLSMPELYKKGDTSRLVSMLNLLQGYESRLNKQDLYKAITIPFDENKPELIELFKSYLSSYINGAVVIKKPCSVNSTILDELELYYKKLDLYYSFGKAFNMNLDLKWLDNEKDRTSESINKLIIGNLNKLKKKCSKCGRTLDFTWEHKMCNTCYSKGKRYSYSYYDDYLY